MTSEGGMGTGVVEGEEDDEEEEEEEEASSGTMVIGFSSSAPTK